MVRIQRAALRFEAASHQVPPPATTPVPASEYFKKVLRFGRMLLSCRFADECQVAQVNVNAVNAGIAGHRNS
jgi:hypothetical protein